MWGKIKEFLFPNSGVCAYCRGNLRNAIGANQPLGLCAACYQNIPWIKDILCPTCGRYETCHDCRRRVDPAFVRNRSAVRYDATMKEWLSRWKYRGDERLLQLFAGMLVHAYHKQLEVLGESDGFDFVVYVPLSHERLQERGFNQAEQLALRLSQQIGVPVIELLTRVRHTNKQSFKGRKERLHDLSGAFAIEIKTLQAMLTRQKQVNRSLRLLLIDDVYTTGSTLQQCAMIIRGNVQAQVYGLTWAR